jgi:hypothetical protein
MKNPRAGTEGESREVTVVSGDIVADDRAEELSIIPDRWQPDSINTRQRVTQVSINLFTVNEYNMF